MSSAKLQLAYRGVAKPESRVNFTAKRSARSGKAGQVVPCRLVRADRQANFEDTEPKLSTTPLSDPFEILRRMPAQALSPALLELLDLLASPILLVTNSPTGELEEMTP